MVALASIVVVAALVSATSVHLADWAWGAASGGAGVVGLILLYGALAKGPMAVVAPITAVCSAVVPVIVGVAEGDRPKAVAVAGIVLALPAIVLVAGDASSTPSAVAPKLRVKPRVLAEAL